MRVLVTRPAPQAAEWVARLREDGMDACALPLICVAPAADASAVREAWLGLSANRLVVFVSPNAAEQFMAARPTSVGWPQGVTAASTGPGTTRALLARGVPAGQIVEPAADAPQFDSEALWRQLRPSDWHGAQVLIVRGDGGREWLADTLRAHGAMVELLAAYRRCAPHLSSSEQALLSAALDAPRVHLWLFSSSEAIDNLAALAGSATDWSRSRALTTHPRIAARAQQLGLGEVNVSRSTLAAIRACIQLTPT
jgi:uroporphyrinogen-III synthase